MSRQRPRAVGSSRHTSAAGTSACTATMPGSASGRTLGEPDPGTSRAISGNRLLAAR